MIPGFGGMNPKKMAAMMKQLGIDQTEIDAKRVVIERDDGNIIINDPSVMKVVVQGRESFQISGEITDDEQEGFSDEDVKMVAEKTGKSEEESKEALLETGDIAEAILKLSK